MIIKSDNQFDQKLIILRKLLDNVDTGVWIPDSSIFNYLLGQLKTYEFIHNEINNLINDFNKLELEKENN